ncbi:telomerase reverse transcriptase-like isoform X2 [Tachypleus tridentatus]|uniref:telomerase reverse transcriptase-like isoform X2 n=1 Tax=Tachypleus tridentatus TaxID=6853 RepID=UPI003FD5E915
MLAFVVNWLYKNVDTLENFVKKNAPAIKFHDDSSFLQSTLVATDEKMELEKVSFDHQMEYEDIVLLAQKLIYQNDSHKWKTNMLTIGERPDWYKRTDPAWTQKNLQRMMKDENLCRITSRHYKMLHALIGDQLIIFLLTKCSVFEEVKPSCYIQRTGEPAYQIWKKKIQNAATDTYKNENRKRNLQIKQACFGTKKRKVLNQSSHTEMLPDWLNKSLTATEHHPQHLSPVSSEHGSCGSCDLFPDGNMSEGTNSVLNCLPLQIPEEKTNPVTHQSDENVPECYSEDANLASPLLSEKTSSLALFSESNPTEINGKHANLSNNKKRKKTRRGKRKKMTPTCSSNNLNPAKKQDNNILPSRAKNEISRSWIFYSKKFREGLPNTFILEKSSQSPEGIEELKHFIFPKNQEVCLQPAEEDVLVPLLSKLLKRHRTCDFQKMVKHHCPVTFEQDPLTLGYLLEQCSSYNQVYNFLRAVIHHIIPFEILGSKRNMRIFVKRIKMLISSGKDDKLYLFNILHGIKVSECAWWKAIPYFSTRITLLENIVGWIIKFLLHLLQSYFYITETGMYKKQLFYFRKPLWQKIQMLGLNELDRNGSVVHISELEVTRLCAEGKSLGTNTIRLLPKACSLRPILNMGSKGMVGTREPHLLGDGKLNMKEVYIAWREFIRRKRQKEDKRQLFFVNIDLQDCFGSMKHELLLEIVKKVLKQNGEMGHRIRKYCVLHPKGGMIRARFVRRATDLCEKLSQHILKDFKELSNCVIVDQGYDEFLSHAAQIQLLEAYVNNCFIKAGKCYYHLRKGISQGGALSSILCNFYLAELEKQYIHSSINTEEDLLMRMVDDYLFITPDLERANTFVKIFSKGIPEYNCTVNVKKVVVNFQSGTESKCLQDDEPLRWVGLEIDTKTLQIRLDYKRYEGICVPYTMSIDHKNMGQVIKTKIPLLAVLHCTSLILDTELNEEKTVIKNIFEKFFLSAYRFHALVMKCPVNRRLQNPQFILGVILDTSYTMFQRIKTYMKSLNMAFSLSRREIEWICLKAFQIRFSMKQALYKPLLTPLRKLICWKKGKIDKEKLAQCHCLFSQYPTESFRLIHERP